MLEISLRKTLESIDWKPFNPYQIFLALVGNLLDLFTTREALLHNPYAFEGNILFGNIPWLDISITVIVITFLQLSKVYYNTTGDKKSLKMVNITSWLCVLIPYIVVINNIMLIP